MALTKRNNLSINNFADQNTPFPGNNQRTAGDDEVKKQRHSEFTDVTKDILEALRCGDYIAFEKVYNKCIQPMRALFRLILQNDTDVEDQCQELFIKLWEQRERIDPDSNFRAYLYQMARTSAFMVIRRRNVVNKFMDFKFNTEPDIAHSPDSEFLRKEIMLMMRLALRNMPPLRRKVFEMSRIEGLKHEEIAKRLNISSGNVSNHLNRALKDIKELITLIVFFLSQ